MKHILKLILLILNLLCVVALLWANLSQLFAPNIFSFGGIIGIGFMYLVIANIPFVIAWLFTDKRAWSILSLIAILCSIPAINKTIRFQKPTPLIHEKQISILSYNTHCLGFQTNKPLNKIDILNYIKQENADVVCLQEFVAFKDGHTWQAIKEYLGYPYSYIDFKKYKGKRQYGLAVFSRYPLINKTTLAYESSTNISNFCDIVIESDTLRLFNNHLQSNMLRSDDFMVESKNNVDQLQEKAEVIGKKLHDGAALRGTQAKVVQEAVAQSPYSVVVVGDFNDVPISYTYRTISRHLKDAFIENSSWALGHTFYKKRIGIRIDYILHSPTLSSSDFIIDTVNYSDHYPIACTISW